MARTESAMLPLGTPAPDFDLTDVVSGRSIGLHDFRDERGLLVMFLSRHCPFVKHVQKKLAELGNAWSQQGVGVVAICSNDVERYPDDSPTNLRQMAEELGFEFPYLHDPEQDVAKAYRAACTPDFFLFDGDRRLAYRGQLDDSRPGNALPVTGGDLGAAVEAVLAGRPVAADQKPSIGCNIKWKPGNEPQYYTS